MRDMQYFHSCGSVSGHWKTFWTWKQTSHTRRKIRGLIRKVPRQNLGM